MFPSSTSVWALLVTFVAVVVSLWMFWGACYQAPIYTALREERNKTFWTGLLVGSVAFVCVFFIGTDCGRDRYVGMAKQSLTVGETYRVIAQKGAHFLLESASTETTLYYEAGRADIPAKEGSYYVIDLNHNWHLTVAPLPKTVKPTK